MRTRPFPTLLVLPLLLLFGTSPAAAAEYRRLALSGGTDIAYALVLPEHFQKDRAYPAILAFPGGRQSITGVASTLERFWETEARKRGFIVISPAAPAGKPFFEDGADLIPEFLGHFLDAYRIKDGRFHIAGHSTGAVSAFRAAVRNPQMLCSVIALAGFPEEQEDFDRLERLKGLEVTMFVGDGDQYWKEGMQKTKDALETFGTRVSFTVLPRNGHFLPDIAYDKSWKIFDRIPKCRMDPQPGRSR